MRVLVTGGAGYIGSHTCKILSELGHNSLVVDNLSTGHADAVRWSDFVEMDVRDNQGLKRVFQSYSPDAVIHFAALAEVEESMRTPATYIEHNVSSTVSVLEAMRVNQVRDLVFSSSCAVYGTPTQNLLSENHRLEPVNPYGLSKKMCEDVLRTYSLIFGLRCVSLRYFNASGGDSSGQLGENHSPETHLIPRVISRCLELNPIITINGDDYETPDGTCIRDYVHVLDLASAHIQSINYLRSGGDTVEVNLGSGRGTSVRQVVDEVALKLGRSPLIKVGARRSGDPSILMANSDRARNLLGWEPEHSDLAVIITDAIFGFRNSRTKP